MDDPVLSAEAGALHRALFGRDAPGEIARLYAEAHASALTRVTDAEREWMLRAKGADLEALEIAVRRRDPGHVLSRKMRLLAYLCEASPDYFQSYVNEEPRRLAAFFSLARHAARTVLKRLKGWVLLKARGL